MKMKIVAMIIGVIIVSASSTNANDHAVIYMGRDNRSVLLLGPVVITLVEWDHEQNTTFNIHDRKGAWIIIQKTTGPWPGNRGSTTQSLGLYNIDWISQVDISGYLTNFSDANKDGIIDSVISYYLDGTEAETLLSDLKK
ncbi:hypothetical protein QUF90_12770 [Desulfococcaceae bacterium HSG9]|nr:hypothetical protein [Desulfococcaceae bacterium HSG9]